MFIDFLYGIIGIFILTVYCIPGAFLVPKIAYWFMTPYALELLEKSEIERKMNIKDKAIVAIITLAAGVLFILTIIFAGKQGVDSGMGVWRLSLRFLIFFWMISIYDAVVLDWWMFTKTDIFGLLIKAKTGKTPDVMRVDPQWDGKEVLKLILELIFSIVLAWIFIKLK